MKWAKNQFGSWRLNVADGFVTAGIGWSITGASGYVARVNGYELLGRTSNLEATKRHVEAYILMKLAECQKQMEDANA